MTPCRDCDTQGRCRSVGCPEGGEHVVSPWWGRAIAVAAGLLIALAWWAS